MSIVSEADKYFAEEVLGLDSDNAKGLLDLYGEGSSVFAVVVG